MCRSASNKLIGYRSSQRRCSVKKGVLKNSQESTCVGASFLKTSLKKGLQHRCFLMNFAKNLRTFFFIEHLQWLLRIVIHTTAGFIKQRYCLGLIICSRRNCFTQFICAIQLNDIHIINIKITLSFKTLPPRSIRFCLIRLEVLYEKSLTTIHKFR